VNSRHNEETLDMEKRFKSQTDSLKRNHEEELRRLKE